MSMQESILPAQESAKTLENYLKKHFPIGYVRKLFRKNGIRVNDQRAKPGDLVRHGDRIQIFLPFEKQTERAAETFSRFELPTLFEDDELLVINKPPGIAVHEAKEILKRQTVLGILETKYRSTGVRPRLVHRLDKDTSGILVVAKTEKLAEELEARFEEGEVDKEYLCLVAGRLPQKEGKIDFPLPGREEKAVRALTHFRVIQRFSETTLVRVAIETGRMHQIRLHFAKLGYPVVMDAQHGDFGFNKRFRKEFGLKRQFLHASKITLDYHGRKRIWNAPLHRDLDETLKAVGAGLKPAPTKT
jgi:23S rRNA pseudouridine955/2504/2580 synthase